MSLIPIPNRRAAETLGALTASKDGGGRYDFGSVRVSADPDGRVELAACNNVAAIIVTTPVGFTTPERRTAAVPAAKWKAAIAAGHLDVAKYASEELQPSIATACPADATALASVTIDAEHLLPLLKAVAAFVRRGHHEWRNGRRRPYHAAEVRLTIHRDPRQPLVLTADCVDGSNVVGLLSTVNTEVR
jgi:hypothetical protein